MKQAAVQFNDLSFHYCEQSELSSTFNGRNVAIYIYIFIFQVDRHSVNVLNVSTCILLSAQCDIPQCKYIRANVSFFVILNIHPI